MLCKVSVTAQSVSGVLVEVVSFNNVKNKYLYNKRKSPRWFTGSGI